MAPVAIHHHHHGILLRTLEQSTVVLQVTAVRSVGIDEIVPEISYEARSSRRQFSSRTCTETVALRLRFISKQLWRLQS
eukprot:1029751-Rhodomonas_salina.1